MLVHLISKQDGINVTRHTSGNNIGRILPNGSGSSSSSLPSCG